MIFYVAFDDTDTLDCGRGTGKLARWFMEILPQNCNAIGVVRQQLLHSPEIPMTSHNSALCCIVDAPDNSYRNALIELGIGHIQNHFFQGSDPGFCVASESDRGLNEMVEFGIRCTEKKVNQNDAFEVTKHVHLSGHGGTNDGIIGATAAVGLTYWGNSGRFVDYRDIRSLPPVTSAGELRERDIQPISVNRHAEYIPDHDSIANLGSLRPHLFNRKLIVPVAAKGKQNWEVLNTKKEY